MLFNLHLRLITISLTYFLSLLSSKNQNLLLLLLLLRIEFSTFESIDRFMVDSPIGVPRELVGLIKIFIRKTSPRGDIYRNLWHTFLGVYCYILIINFFLVRLVFFCFLLFYFMKIGCLNNVISVSCLISTVALIESPGREEFVVKHEKLSSLFEFIKPHFRLRGCQPKKRRIVKLLFVYNWTADETQLSSL